MIPELEAVIQRSLSLRKAVGMSWLDGETNLTFNRNRIRNASLLTLLRPRPVNILTGRRPSVYIHILRCLRRPVRIYTPLPRVKALVCSPSPPPSPILPV